MKLIGPFKQLITMDRIPLNGPLSDDDLEIIPNGGILISERHILKTGDFDKLALGFHPSEIERLNTSYIAFPGLIDTHTHICWAGSRANDYALRLSGKSYQDIAELGGGIWSTVEKTREASVDELVKLTVERANKLLKQGLTTVEVKSGYGLSVEQELKILNSIHDANDMILADLIPTCLAAHILPKDFQGNETDYLEYLIKELLPEVSRQKLSGRVDIYVDKGAFSIPEARDYLMKAKELGFDLIIHGDQFSSGTASLAVEVGALSIDHLEYADEKEIDIISKSNVIPIVLPGASIGLGEPFAPARKFLDAGAPLVIASDWNPGSAPMGNLLTEASILGAFEKLTMTEIFAAMTCRAAGALKLLDRGILKSGNLADIIAFKTDNYKDILYQQGLLQPSMIWKNGFCGVNKDKH